MDDAQLRTLARRALARARAEHPAPAGSVPAVGSETERPAAAEQWAARGPLTADDLRSVAPGTTLRLPAGARPTPLARDEAWARGIRLVEETR